ncbi:MAG TPA: two-component regulator propeller domain-containing protein [Flavobacteriales bacterium]|nr:two-component regulator propeller domain-containing protein [Flavobacteriales bacterium]
MAACNAQAPAKTESGSNDAQADTTQLAEYIVAAFEDSRGNLWFGTVGEGVIRYEPKPLVVTGERLTYFTTADGLADMVACSIVEDQQGNVWIGSHDGATRFDGKTFTAFKAPEGLHGAGCVLLVDRKGTLWAGTNDGAFRFNGERFIPFEMPVPEIDKPSHKWVKGKVWALLEDSKGNIWFGRDGYGACKYDGRTFTHFTTKDGLCSNNVARIEEDAQGNIWFGSITSDFPPIKEGGVARFDGKSFTRFPEVKGLTDSDVYMVFAERSGKVWVCPVGVGAYRFDGRSFTLFDRTERPHLIQNFGVQAVLEDSRGTLWFGFSGGLFRFNGSYFENVTRGELK